MISILSSTQLQEADKYTILHEPIEAIDLMERAAMACCEWIAANYQTSKKIVVCCGIGNNGGDGLAIARLLIQKNFNVAAMVVGEINKSSELFKINYERLSKILPNGISQCSNNSDFSSIDANTIVIDALFGTGLNRKPDALALAAINYINENASCVISIDVPSGMYVDPNKMQQIQHAVRANLTLTFHAPKLAFLFPEGGAHVGKLIVLDIGLHPDFISTTNSTYHYVSKQDIEILGKKRPTFSHKGNFGHAFLLAGSNSKMGAAVLCANAAMRSGVGMVTASVPEHGKSTINNVVPEVMVQEGAERLQLNMDLSSYTAIGVGPGLGVNNESAQELKLLIQNYKGMLILDADAITILALNKTWLSFLPPLVIFTPHPKEFERLCGKADNSFHRIQIAKEFCMKYTAYLILKGKYTCLVCPDGNCYFNSTGNSGMAKAGSGDVLAGLLTGLAAQGYTPFAASLMAVYIHGMAGDYAAGHFSEYAMKAGDIISFFPKAFKQFSWENSK